jgi:peptidyl-prolyl cis-trans isomerase C
MDIFYIKAKKKNAKIKRRFAMVRMWTSIAAVVLTLLAVSGIAAAADANKPAGPDFSTMNPDEVMAKYGDQKLTLKEVKFFVPSVTPESARQLAQQWLDLQMLYAAAQSRGLTNDPKSKLMAELNSKQVFARELMNKVASEVNVPASEVREYYEKNKNTDPQLSEPNRLSFAHVKTKTAEEANAVKKRIEAGEDIEKIAKELSTAADAKNGGSVKKAPQQMVERQYSKEFADALLAASEGKIVGPISVRDGFEVARHEGKLSSKVRPFEQVEQSIKGNLEQKEKSEASQKFMDELKKESKPKMYMSPLLEAAAPKGEEGKSAQEQKLPVDKTKTKSHNAEQKN